MSLNFPFLGFPGFKQNITYKPPLMKHKSSTITNISHKSESHKENNFNSTNKYADNINEDCFEIFGIKLHYDDLLLISLIFVLFKEGVEDTELFIALILLLLS